MSTTARKVTRPGETGPRVEQRGNTWHIRSTEVARQVLRARDMTTQAGFDVENMPTHSIGKPPILFLDGEAHRTQRAKVARFFAPKVVATRYRDLMDKRADTLVAEALSKGEFRLDDLSLRYSVDIAARVIGLTDSNMDGMAHRLEHFFQQPLGQQASSRLMQLRQTITHSLPLLHFYWRDVRPAIRARRKNPQEDVVSHLISEGYDDQSILVECITFGAAGMVTTREFICMAVWHLLGNPALRDRYLVAGEPERYAILQEILRLEPIVGHLFRRAQADIEITDGDQTYTIPAGDLVDLHIRQVNADPTVVGDDPETLCPGRSLPRGVGPEVESFGDGPHVCPGNSLAIQESDVLLRKLLAERLEIVREPDIAWDELIAGYSLRGFQLRISNA